MCALPLEVESAGEVRCGGVGQFGWLSPFCTTPIRQALTLNGETALLRAGHFLSALGPPTLKKVRDDAPDAPPRSIDSAEVATPYKTCTMKTDFQVCLATTIMHVRLR